MLALLDTLVPLLIFAAFAFVSYLLKRKARDEHEEEFGPGPGGPPRPGRGGERPERRKTWEEELRELLENRLPQPPVVREAPPAPPPVVFPPPRRPEAPPPLVEAHRHWQESAASESEQFETSLAQFRESTQRLEQAAHLDERVARQLAEMKGKPTAYTIVAREHGSEAARRAVALIRNPQTVRSAVVASLILGPPAALAERS